MSYVNFATRMEVQMEVELEKYRSGEIRIGVSNQFDEYMLESALEEIQKDEVKERVYNMFGRADNPSPVSVAYNISKFKPEPLDNAWTD